MSNPQGTPQGSVILPLLTNIALHRIKDLIKEYYCDTLYRGSSKVAIRDRKAQIALIRLQMTLLYYTKMSK